MTAIQFVSRPTFRDLARITVEQSFRSMGAQAIHGFGWGVAGFGLVIGIPADTWLPPALIGVLVGTGLLGVFMQWWLYGRHPDRLVETVSADDAGIVIQAPGTEIHHAWRVFRDARETPAAFVLSSTRAMGQVLAKRGVSEPALEQFRSRLRSAGLLRPAAAPSRAVVGFVLGVAAAVSLPFVAGIVRVG
jgi:hypothetical protein